MGGLLLLALVAYASLTFLGSTLTRSSLAAAATDLGATPGGLNSPGAAEALGKDSGSIIGPVFVNRAGVVAVFAVAWLVFRRQEL